MEETMIPGWLDDMENEVLACLAGRQSLALPELARALGVSEECAASYVALLAGAGRVVIERVALPSASHAACRPRLAA
jgi:hypothetical protein